MLLPHVCLSAYFRLEYLKENRFHIVGEAARDRAGSISNMGFMSFMGRVTFSAIFILAAWQKIQDFGQDGGEALRAMDPKFSLFLKNVNEALNLHLTLPSGVETKHLLMVAIALEGLGGILFTLGSTLGAYLLLIFLAAVTPVMHDFYNYDIATGDYLHQFNSFLKVCFLSRTALYLNL